MRKIILLLPVFLMLGSGTTLAAEQHVTLSIPTMDCPVCPITIKKALEKREGIVSANIDFDSKTAKVIFDDAVVNSAQISAITKDAGYPSTIIKAEK